MTSERIVLLAILTACLFATTVFADTGLFLLPFGLFKPGLFLVSLLLVIAQRKITWTSGVLLIATFSLAASSLFVLHLFFPISELTEARYETISSIGLILFSLLFLVWQILISMKEKSPFRLLQVVNAVLICTCILTNQYVWLIVPTLMWFVSVLSSRAVDSMSKSFAGLFLFVVTSSWISGLYFGYAEILGNL